MKITTFPFVFFRTPYFPYQAEDVDKILSTPMFDESVYLASPDLYAEKSREEKSRKRHLSLHKYATRAITRCTPFGLFAGCSMATIGAETAIQLANQAEYTRCTRLDMHYVGTLVQHLSDDKVVRSQLAYYPNDSLYRLGGKLRYVEYYYNKTRRLHNLSAVDPNEYVELILRNAKQGATIYQLASPLVNDEISMEEAVDFIHELIDNQLLKSEFELRVTGADLLPDLLAKLNKRTDIEPIKNSLKQIYSLLQKIDGSPIGTSLLYYEDIIAEINAIGVPYEKRYLFQTDLFKPVKQATVSSELIKSITEGLNFLNKLTTPPKETLLSRFKDAYYERYEERTVPLVEALDKELGIGYPANSGDGDQSLLTNSLVLPTIPQPSDVVVDTWGKVLLSKYIKAIQEKQKAIELTDEDVKDRKSSWEDMPSTLAAMCQIVSDKQAYVSSASGGATNLLGRFCHLDKSIESHVKAIAQKEQDINPEAIYAEVVHLPESRTGNILFRPVLRNYEIPYLCAPGVGSEYVIPLTDLMLCIRNNRLVLSSVKLGKEIIPRLSTAHNYHYSMPIYRFLCDMYSSRGRNGVYFTWGGVDKLFDYLPRVVYKNCILSKAAWVISKEVLDEWQKLDEDVLVSTVVEYRSAKNIPDKVAIPDNDNKLFIDFTNTLGIQMLLDMAKKRNGIAIEEFLFDEESAIVKSDEGIFCNEFIFTFYKADEDGGK